MRVYSKTKEKLLSYIGYRHDPEKGFSWSFFSHTYLQSWAERLVKAEQIFERGLDVEELTLIMTGDTDKAWDAAEPYYNAARSKGFAKAYYRIAMRWGQNDHSEFIYGHYLEGAAKRGYMPAVQDFVEYYEEFKVKTITKDAWKRKRKQEKVYFHCCKILAEAKDPDALWNLGTCYLFGTGVKKDAAKGLLIRDCAIENGVMDEDRKATLIAIQNTFKSFEMNERPRYTIFTAFKELFSINNARERLSQAKSRDE